MPSLRLCSCMIHDELGMWQISFKQDDLVASYGKDGVADSVA